MLEEDQLVINDAGWAGEKKTQSGRWWGTGRLQRGMKSPGQVECGGIVMHHT